MKKNLKYMLVAVFTLVSLAGYAYVEYAPFSPQQRISKIRKTALVGVFVESWELRQAEKLMDNGDPIAARGLLGIADQEGDEELRERALSALGRSSVELA